MTTHSTIAMPMPIVTPRLTIRPVMPGDGADLYAAKVETWEQLRRWMIWTKFENTLDLCEQHCAEAYRKTQDRADDIMMVALRRDTGKPVLFTGFHDIDWTARRFEIGFWCRQSEQRQGFVTESTNALTRYCFDIFQAKEITLYHAEGNVESQRIIQKLGFSPDPAVNVQGELPDGRSVTHLFYTAMNTNALPPLEMRLG